MRYAHAVYCDDIRHEMGGKISMIGIYNGQLGVPYVPCTVPKLCISISIRTPKDELFNSLSLVGKYSDAEVFRMELAKADLDALVAQGTAPAVPGKYFLIQLVAILSPLQLEKTGTIELTLLADGQELDCEALQVVIEKSDGS